MSFEFPQQCMNLLSVLQLLLFVLTPPAAAKRVYVGTPHTPAKGLPSALPCVHTQTLCPLHSLTSTPRPCALCTPLRPCPRASCRVSQILCLCTPYSSGFDEASSNLARRNKVNISCSSMRKLAVFAFCLALITMSNPPGSPGIRPRIASLSSRFI